MGDPGVTLRRLLSKAVTIVRISEGPAADEYGNPKPGEAGRSTLKGRLEPARGEELTADRQTAIGEWRLYLGPDADGLIDTSDRVEADGLVFEVSEPPARFTDARGRVHHLEVRLRHITGD